MPTLKKNENKKHHLNERFGRLLVRAIGPRRIYMNGRRWTRRVYARCECGVERLFSLDALLYGYSRSCGCLQKELAKVRTHGLSKINGKRNRLYQIWLGAKARCSDKNLPHYKHYGGRGIRICKEWKDNYMSFHEWAMKNGYEEHLTLERNNVNGNYHPKNCRWILPKEQAWNRRNNHYLTYKGKRLRVTQWAKELGVSYAAILFRIKRGWGEDKIFHKGKLPLGPPLGSKHKKLE